MNRDTFSYDCKSENLQKALNLHEYEGCVLCAVCRSELIIISGENKKLIRKHNLQPGIYSASRSDAIHFDLSPNLSPKRREALNFTPQR